MKEELCQAFCGDLKLRKVPAGFAVSTVFDGIDGDPIGFYVVGPDAYGKYRIEDSGVLVPHLEAYGADLKNKARLDAFNDLLEEYEVNYDEDTGELISNQLSEQEIPKSALRFIALLLRVQDIMLMATERAASTFRADAMRTIEQVIGDKANIKENDVVDPKLAEFPADVVIRAENQKPVAVFFGTSDQKVTEAILLQMTAAYEAKVPCSVVALLEKELSISRKTMQRATNRLNATPIYRGDEQQAIARIEREAFGAAMH